MKPDTRHKRARQPWRRRGMALVIVLSSMALIMLLVLAMLVAGRTETRSAAAFSKSVEVRSLAEMPVNLVMAQIRKATSGLRTERTWMSQPGMIRVFGTEPGQDGRARLESAWKLYSADQMVTGPGFDAKAEAASLVDWSTQPALYTDLNQPVAVAGTGGAVRRVYPILDPAALEKVEGVAISASGGQAPGATAEQPVPMPVRWLYLLQDGRLVLPVTSTGATATFDETVVTKDNPIVGRIAFWTDDESCKVNINTASEGAPWDVPRTVSWTERNYGTYLPAQNEFQRYPGHPAMTCLSTVLQAFDDRYWRQGPAIDETGHVTNPKYPEFLAGIYALTPRTNDGLVPGESSRGGSQEAGMDPDTRRVLLDPVTGKPRPLSMKHERLFATVDELFYTSDREVAAGLEPEELQSARFFLTAHSRAPETNLFNRPRISLWPLQAEPGKRNAKDKLLAFCATAAGQECGFQRATTFTGQTNGKWGSSQSTRQDRELSHNQRVLGYAAALTSKGVPGFGTESFVDKYGAMNRGQILLSMFDLTRWGVNSYTNSLPVPDSTNGYTYLPPRLSINPGWMGEFSAAPVTASTMPGPDGSLAAPIKAFGRFPTVVEATLVFMATEVERDARGVPVDKKNNFTGEEGADNWADNTTRMQAFLILQPFSPTAGMPMWTANVRYVVNGLDQFKADGAALGFPARGVNLVRCPSSKVNDLGNCTSFTGITSAFYKFDSSAKAPGAFNEDRNYPFTSADESVANKKEFRFDGGTISVEVRTGFPAADQSELVQTLQLNFPPATIRVPRLGKHPTQRETWLTAYMNMTSRLQNAKNAGTGYPSPGNSGNGRQMLIGIGDMARSVVVDPGGPSKGDLRHVAALPEVPANYFMPHPDYANPAVEEAQTLRHSGTTAAGHYGNTHTSPDLPDNLGRQHAWQVSGYQVGGRQVGKSYGLLKDVPYWQDCQPAVTTRLDGAWNADQRPGDWDNGPGRIEDGPYINKPDEGSLFSSEKVYFSRGSNALEDGRSFAPNRQICSAVAFGSLPSGVYASGGGAGRPWQTLLFCPNPPSRTTAADKEPTEQDHYGFKAPRDHLLLDLFWMPIVDPYAISEPLSTAGKVNMNTQMLPFSYIERDTALHAALRGLRLGALPSLLAWAGNADTTGASAGQLAECYKSGTGWLKYDTIYEVNATETLKGLKQRFEKNDVYRSASEICEVFLAPRPSPNRDYAPTPAANSMPRYSQLTTWWNGSLDDQKDGFELTGDNTRESPYNQLYPRLTTRSNVFQVHYRVQLIQKTRSSAPHVWDEAKEKPVAETRGSTLIERYADPNDPALPNFVANPDAPDALDDHYRFRVIRQKQFAP